MKPLTPPECDLRGLPCMMLDWLRLLDSDLFALSTGDEFKAAVALWGKAWHQVPAASLPDDERILARWVGVSLAEWRALAPMALRGWVRCSDGRLYHAVVADKALMAWKERLQHQKKSAAGHAARGRSVPPPETFDRAVEVAETYLASLSPTGDPKPPSVPEAKPEPAPSSGSPAAGSENPCEGRGIGKGIEEEASPLVPSASPSGTRKVRTRTEYPPLFQAAWAAYPHHKGRSSKPDALTQWRKLSAEQRDQLEAACRRYAAEGSEPNRDCGAPAMDRWLRRGLHENWLTPAEPEADAEPVDEVEVWRRMVRAFRRDQHWPVEAGPKPGKEGCRAPSDILVEFGYAKADAA